MILAFDIQADNDEPSDSYEEQATFENRMLEFWDAVSMSFSTPDEDRFVTAYKSLAPPKVLNRNWLWCPIVEPNLVVGQWLDYSPRVREAIRLGFRRGLGLQTDYHCWEPFDHWKGVESGFMDKVPMMTQLIRVEAEKTRQFALASTRMEYLLNRTYGQAIFVPYHPQFDRDFIMKLSQLPLHRITDFLNSVCQRNGLDNPEGYAYMNDLITDVCENHWITQQSKVARAREWMRASTHAGNFSPSTTKKTNILEISEWSGLLCQPERFGLSDLINAFQKVLLIGENGQPTEWGRKTKGGWAGAIDALTAPPALLSVNTRAVCRCLASWGIIISENTMRNNTSTEAENTLKAMQKALIGLRK